LLSLKEVPRVGADVTQYSGARPYPVAKPAPPPGLVPQRRLWFTGEVLVILFAFVDLALVVAAASLARWVCLGLTGMVGLPQTRFILTSLLAAVLFLAVFERTGGYQVKRLWLPHWQITRALAVWSTTLAILLTMAYTAKISGVHALGWFATWAILGGMLLGTARGALHPVIMRSAVGVLARNIAIVGAGEEAEWVIGKVTRSRDPRVTICGLFDDRFSRLPAVVSGINVLGTTEHLITLVQQDVFDEIIVALPLDEPRLPQLLNRLRGFAVDLQLSVGRVGERFEVSGVNLIGDIPVLAISNRPIKHWRALLKWLEDKLLSSFLLLWLSPLLGLIALLIKLESRGPILFVQERVGFNNNVIRVIKFRTMHIHRGDPTGAIRTIRDDPRVTRLGRWLRRLSLDELPQLINVLRGDMSIVGPRPHALAMRVGDLLYSEAIEEYCRRHRMKPGITGWAQVNGLRGEIDTLAKAQARVDHDLYYIEHWSPWLELRILLMTAGILLVPNDVY
jgi:Undecaprenyl-phosphate glucose phosphotransferase